LRFFRNNFADVIEFFSRQTGSKIFSFSFGVGCDETGKKDQR
jgi:hypothetical protein